jgi:tol-pal system protein YbgF
MTIYSKLLFGCLIGVAGYAVAQAPVSDLNTGSLEQRVSELERLVSSRTSAQHRIQSQLDTIQDEVNELRGTLEVHNFKLEQILQRQRELYLEIDNRIQAVTASGAVSQPAPTTPAAPNSDQNYVLAAGEDDAYDKAINLILKERRYDEAVPAFESFLANFPNSSYAANAHYWLGQLLFNKQEWAQSKSHFERVVNQYVDSNKRSDALLKLGEIAQKQNNLARAKQLFEQVISEYPESSARKLADNRLRALN